MFRLTPAVCAVALLVPAVVSAQPTPGVGPARRPTFSPYLNLLGGVGNPAFNYLGIVRPQQQLAQQFNQLQQQANQANLAIDQAFTSQAEVLSSFLAPTGNVAVFNSTAGYFNRIGGGGIGGFGGVGGSSFGVGGFNRSGGPGGANISNRPSFAGGGGAGGLNRPAAGGMRR